jgi:hypothetical protein
MADLKKMIDDLSKLDVIEASELVKMLGKKWSAVESKDSSLLLFERRERTRTEPLRRGEKLFEFYDSCVSVGYEEFRVAINGWLADMPAEARLELITRMRYGGDREFGAALSELALHAFIIGSGYHASPHPQVAGSSKRPDYAAIEQSNVPLAYVEVTTVNPPIAQEAEKNRENPIFNAINDSKIPAGSILGYKLVHAGKSSPALRPLVVEIERWASENSEAAKHAAISKTFTAGEWTIELELYAGGSSTEPPTQAIGAAELRGGVIAPQKDLRDALFKKSREYGTLDKPYLIAVADGKDQLFGKDSIRSALTEAVFGDEVVQFQGHTHRITHAKNGFWHGPQGPRNRHVSGVIFLPETRLWKLREERWEPLLAINPWAERPLPDALRKMNRFEADGDRWIFREGKRFAYIIGLPDPWPPKKT